MDRISGVTKSQTQLSKHTLKSYKGKKKRNFVKDLPVTNYMSMFFDYLLLFDCLGAEQIFQCGVVILTLDLHLGGSYFLSGIAICILICHNLLYINTNLILKNIVTFLQYNSISSYVVLNHIY